MNGAETKDSTQTAAPAAARTPQRVAAGLLALAAFWVGLIWGGPLFGSIGSGCDGLASCVAVNKFFAAVAALFGVGGLAICVQGIKLDDIMGARVMLVEVPLCACLSGSLFGFTLLVFGTP